MSDPSAALISALLTRLIKVGALAADDIADIREDLDGDDEAIRLLTCAVAEAEAPTASEWQAAKARARFRVVAPDGGNKAD